MSMDSILEASVVVAGVPVSGSGLVVALLLLFVGFLALIFFWWREVRRSLRLTRSDKNPILVPRPDVWWESEAVFNPAALYDNGRVHLL